jgi:hypothetical protein
MKPRIQDDLTFYFSEDIEAELTPEEMKKFNKWICGQTGCIVDGKFAYYSWDVERFINMVRKGTITYFD